jgi:hypothetical protein
MMEPTIVGRMRRTSYEDMNCSVAQPRGRGRMVVSTDPARRLSRDAAVRRLPGPPRDLPGRAESAPPAARRARCAQTVPYQEHPPRHEYRLTDKGRDLWLVVAALRQWGDKWAAPDGPPLDVIHTACGHVTDAVPTCSQCGEPLEAGALRAVPGPGGRTTSAGESRRGRG